MSCFPAFFCFGGSGRADQARLLDVARETYKENLNDAFELCEEMKEKYGIEMGMDYGASGCVFFCSKAELEGKELPRIFINVVSPLRVAGRRVGADKREQNKKAKKFEFSSMDLKKKNSRIQESVQEIFLMRCVSRSRARIWRAR